jgi:hypothetical protein
MWFTESPGNQIGRITPAGVVTEFWSGIIGGAVPTGIANGPDGRLWFTEASSNQIGRITTSGVVTEFTTGITAGSSPNAITAGPDGNLWFSEAVGNRIARIGSGVDVLVRAPAIYGAGRVGERALCDEGAWKGDLGIGSYGVQWFRDGLDLAGATGGVYTPVAGDEGHQLGCRVAARPASVLAVYSAQSSAITVGAEAVGLTGATGPAGATGSVGVAESQGPAQAAADGAAGATGASGTAGTPGAPGAGGIAGTAAVLLHTRLTTARGKSFVIRYLAPKGARLVLLIRRRSGLAGTRVATLTTRKSGRGSATARHGLAAGRYTLVLTAVIAGSARVVDTVPLVVRSP